MSSVIDFDKAKELLNSFSGAAELLIKDPSRVEQRLEKAERKLKEIPAIGGTLSRLWRSTAC